MFIYAPCAQNEKTIKLPTHRLNTKYIQKHLYTWEIPQESEPFMFNSKIEAIMSFMTVFRTKIRMTAAVITNCMEGAAENPQN